MKKCVIYARVSSNNDRQDYQRQINDLKEVGYFGDADPCFGDIDPSRRKLFKEQIA